MRYLGFEPSKTKPYYFVSYNAQDDYRVAPLAAELDQSGISLWYDYGIPYDNKWEEVIAEKIYNSESVILFYSRGIVEKENSYVIREYKIARLYKKKINVVLLDSINAADAPFSKVSWLLELNEHHTIPGYSQTTEYICKEILRALDWRMEDASSGKTEKFFPELERKDTEQIVCNGNIVEETIQEVIEKYGDNSVFSMIVSERLKSIKPAIVAKELEYRKNGTLKKMVEADQEISFDIHWEDDRGIDCVNRGYLVQFSKDLGPYRGAIRFHPVVNMDMMKMMCFQRMLRFAITTFPLGSSMAGSDFSPRSRSDREIKNFCQNFIKEVSKYFDKNADILHGDIGVGLKELTYMEEAYRKERESSEVGSAVIEPSPLMKDACGYGLLYITKALWKKHGMSFEGKTAVVSGSGNVAISTIEKAQQLGIKVIACSDMNGWIFDSKGIDVKLLKGVKTIRRASLSEYAAARKTARFYDSNGIWQCKADFAFPCAMQNEIGEKEAALLAASGVSCVVAGANMPLTMDAERYLKEKGVLILGNNVSNIGTIIVSHLQRLHPSWNYELLDRELEKTMEKIFVSISNTVEKYGLIVGGNPDYVMAADITAFERVADAMR